MEYITHSGVKGMKWGVRRYQNKDGSLTPLGRRKLEGYRNNAMEKAKKKSEYHRDSAESDKRYLRELKTEGVKSRRLKEEFEWAEDSGSLMDMLLKEGGLENDSGAILETLLFGEPSKSTKDRVALKAFLSMRTEEVESDYRSEIKIAKKYTAKYENLKIMDLDSKANAMDYKSIKRSIKNA